MRHWRLVFISIGLSLFGYANPPLPVAIDTVYTKITINETEYTIAAFHYENPTSTDFSYMTDAPPSIKIGLITSPNILVNPLWEFQSMADTTRDTIVQSITVADLNKDTHSDIIINFFDNESDYPDYLISTFLIYSNNGFQEITETFVKNNYELLASSHLKYKTPLTFFGRPYVDENDTKEGHYWVDHYAFKGQKLVNINDQYQSFYHAFKKESESQLAIVLKRIADYPMSGESTTNQLQLEEYYNEVTELKTIIQRANQLLN